MFADLGFYLLLLCCLTSIYSTVASFVAAGARHRRLYRSARVASSAVFVMALVAALLLWYMFFQRDYSVAYIAKNSSNDLPIFYTITAFWSSLEGSHFLWTLLLSGCAVVALWTYSKDNEHIMPHVCGALMAVLSWMFYLLLTHSDPFVMMLPAPENGNGMNTLLQNPYMAIHPPTLFLGYTLAAIPAAYGIAALLFGDITEGWLKTVRRWAIFSWFILTAGIALGGRWAYVELGWAGYWAWDPVENSSFLPWIFGTALLHSLIIQDKLGHLKRLSIVLAFLAFFFSFFGTFITRSGVISSVHSFAESPIGPNYLMFLGVMLSSVVTLFLVRGHSILPPEADKVWGVSKESALVITQFLLLTLGAIVCVGTLYPIVSEAVTGQRTTVQAPYFNAFAPWIGLGLVVTIAIGNLMRFQTAKIPHIKRTLIISLIGAIPFTLIMIYFGDVMLTKKPFNLGIQIVGMYLCSWSIICLLADAYIRIKDLRWKWKLFFSRNLGYVGALVAHIGLVVAIIGFLGNYRGVQKVATLKIGEMTELFGFEFTFDKMDIQQVENAKQFQAHFDVNRYNEHIGGIMVARSQYPTKAELLHEVGVLGLFWEDLYITMSDFDKTTFKSATFEIHVNPTVRVVWISIVIMVLGGLIAIFDKVRGNKSRDVLRLTDV